MQLFFSRKSGRGTEKGSKTWKSMLKFFWNVLCDQWLQNLKVVGRNFLQVQQTIINGSMIGYVTPLIFFYFPWFWSSSGGNSGWGEGQSWTKKANFGCPVSVKIENFQRLFKLCLFLLYYYLWWKFQQNWTVFEGVRTQKLPIKGYFMDAESVRKALKFFNLTNHEWYTDKTYQDYLHRTFILVKIWGVTHWV